MGHPGRDDSIYARESIRIEAIKKMTSVWKITDDIDGLCLLKIIVYLYNKYLCLMFPFWIMY